MASTRTTLRRRLGVLIAGAVALTALSAGTAEAATPAPMAGQTVGLMGLDAGDPGSGQGARLRARTGASTSPRTPIPGFLLERGRYTRFDAPGAGGGTSPNGINNRGVIVGDYLEDDADATYHGFLLDRGKVTRIDVPGAAQTQAVGINNLGQVVGEYQTPDGSYHGFLWHKRRFTTIDLPGAAGTSLVDINDRGQILGLSLDSAGRFHGLLLDQGCFTNFDAPGVTFTVPRDLNNRGQIAGFTLAPTEADPLAGAQGFLLAKGVKGPFTPIDVPGAPRSAAYGLNDGGAIVGQYENTAATPSPQPTAAMPMGRMA